GRVPRPADHLGRGRCRRGQGPDLAPADRGGDGADGPLHQGSVPGAAPMSWANGYVGIPFRDRGRTRTGCDCWGLARLVYAGELRIGLPDYSGAYASVEERAEIAELLAAAEARGPWRPVAVLQPFDLLLYRRGQHRSHVGIAVGGGRMLHMDGEDRAA